MNNGKLQAKQEKLKSLHCPSLQSSLFNSRGSSLNTQLRSLVFHSPAPNPDLGAKSPSFSSQNNSKCEPSLLSSDRSATRCTQQSSECLTRCLQHNDELAARSPQRLFIDVSTELLRQGQSVRFRAPGLSMYPAIREGETITVAPVTPVDIERGDILLYLVGKKVIAHRVVSIEKEKKDFTSRSLANFAIQSKSDSSANPSTRATTPSLAHSSAHSSTQASAHSKELNPQLIFVLRGDASLTCDDPVEAQQILGKVVSVEKNGRSINLYSRKVKMLHFAHARASRLKRLILRILG